MQIWFISKLRMVALSVKKSTEAIPPSLSRFFSSSCGLLSNQPSPWTHSHAQWTQTTWPIEHPTDCVISAPLNQKQTDWGNFAFTKRLAQIDVPVVLPVAVCLAPFALLLTLIRFHVLTLSVCWTSRVKDSQRC